MRDRPAFDLFLVSWLVLFLELACIRWFPSHVLFLTFFVNIVLLACFVGMSIGCLVSRRPTDYIRHTPYWLLVGLVLGLASDRYCEHLQAVFAVGNPVKPEVVYFGAQGSATMPNPLPFAVPIELVGALFFVIIAGVMIGPGQEMGRAFNRVSDRTTAYSANLLGSLLGIGMFALCSIFRLPPLVWFGLAGLVAAYLLVRKNPDPTPTLAKPQAAATLPVVTLAVAVVLTAVTSGFVPLKGREITWSEYYRVDYHPEFQLVITNLISHQVMESREKPSAASVPYALPYLFQRDLKKPDGSNAWPKYKRILVIGAGNGNDVARALLWADEDTRIDAVEIDPVIQQLGERHHPDRPFQDSRVTVHINDGRNFLRDAKPETYDLVVFALIDSLVLQSGYSNLRLESYLFTLESFKDVRRVLKPTGVAAVYNFLRHGWIAARIRDQLRAAFDTDPVCIVALNDLGRPPPTEVKLNDNDSGACTGFFAGGKDVIDPLRAAFEPRRKAGEVLVPVAHRADARHGRALRNGPAAEPAAAVQVPDRALPLRRRQQSDPRRRRAARVGTGAGAVGRVGAGRCRGERHTPSGRRQLAVPLHLPAANPRPDGAEHRAHTDPVGRAVDGVRREEGARALRPVQ